MFNSETKTFNVGEPVILHWYKRNKNYEATFNGNTLQRLPTRKMKPRQQDNMLSLKQLSRDTDELKYHEISTMDT